MLNFLVLTDNRGYVAGSLLPNDGRKISVEKLKDELEKRGNKVVVTSLHDIYFPSTYKGYYVIYPSSEDYGLRYKDYIEDVLIQLHLDGAVLLPKFELFRAHHNKVFMEMYRGRMTNEYNTIKSLSFYSVQDLMKVLNRGVQVKYPVVLKTSAGAGSSGVALAKNKKELLTLARKMNRAFYFDGQCGFIDFVRHELGKIKRKYMNIIEKTTPKQKMIVQNFIAGLRNDYKVLVFGRKFYLLKRQVRKNDFRASGSGKLIFIDKLQKEEIKVLDFAHQAYEELGTPLLSIDVAYDGKRCHMLEFQCLNFGPYALQYSDGYFTKIADVWHFKRKKSVLEEEMARSYVEFIKQNG